MARRSDHRRLFRFAGSQKQYITSRPVLAITTAPPLPSRCPDQSPVDVNDAPAMKPDTIYMAYLHGVGLPSEIYASDLPGFETAP